MPNQAIANCVAAFAPMKKSAASEWAGSLQVSVLP
jgi:hypothetical protein